MIERVILKYIKFKWKKCKYFQQKKFFFGYILETGDQNLSSPATPSTSVKPSSEVAS